MITAERILEIRHMTVDQLEGELHDRVRKVMSGEVQTLTTVSDDYYVLLFMWYVYKGKVQDVIKEQIARLDRLEQKMLQDELNDFDTFKRHSE